MSYLVARGGLGACCESCAPTGLGAAASPGIAPRSSRGTILAVGIAVAAGLGLATVLGRRRGGRRHS